MRRWAATFLDRAFLRFAVVGATNAALSYAVLRLLLVVLSDHPWRAGLAQAVSYAAGIVWSFFWNRKWTFCHDGPVRRQFAAFVVLQLALLAASSAAMYLLVDCGRASPTAAWLAVMVVVTAVNYLAQRRLVFTADGDAPVAPLVEQVAVATMIALAAVSFGLSYGTDSQSTYLLHGLLAVHPEAIPGDWLAHETIPYHATWVWGLVVTTLLDWWPAGLAFANVAITAVSLWIAYRMVARLTPRLRTAALFLVLGLVVAGHTESVGGSYLFPAVLYPSSAATGLLLAAMATFLAGRFGWSGVLLGLSGYFHTNFLLLAFPLMALAHLLLAGRDVYRLPLQTGLRLLLQLWPCALVLLMRLPMLLAVAQTSSAEGQRILVEIRSPHHYLTARFLPQFIEFGAWSLLGLAGLVAVACRERPVWRSLAAMQLALWLMLAAALVLTTVVYVPQVTQLFFWRLAPFSVLLSQIAFVSAAALLATGEGVRRARLLVAVAATVLGAAALLRYRLHTFPVTAPEVWLPAILLLVPAALVAWRHLGGAERRVRLAGLAMATAALAACLAMNVGYLLDHSTLFRDHRSLAQQQFFAWAAATPETSRFLIPPEVEAFRLEARRAVVADWRSTPLDSAGLVEWYRRMDDITGGAQPKSEREAARAYAALSPEQLRDIARRYQCAYAVQSLRDGQSPPSEGVVFANSEFAVLAVDSASR